MSLCQLNSNASCTYDETMLSFFIRDSLVASTCNHCSVLLALSVSSPCFFFFFVSSPPCVFRPFVLICLSSFQLSFWGIYCGPMCYDLFCCLWLAHFFSWNDFHYHLFSFQIFRDVENTDMFPQLCMQSLCTVGSTQLFDSKEGERINGWLAWHHPFFPTTEKQRARCPCDI